MPSATIARVVVRFAIFSRGACSGTTTFISCMLLATYAAIPLHPFPLTIPAVLFPLWFLAVALCVAMIRVPALRSIRMGVPWDRRILCTSLVVVSYFVILRNGTNNAA